MAKFLTTKNVIASLIEIIEQAENKIVLLSPYVFISKDIENRLQHAIIRNLDVTLVTLVNFQEAELQKWERIGMRVMVTTNLHAKAYYNEKEAIVTSFNLIDSSEKKNVEFGMLVAKLDEDALYSRITRECELVISKSKVGKVSGGKFFLPEEGQAESMTINIGFCIACGGPAEKNTFRPYCTTCWLIWNKINSHPEKYCNWCGREHLTSYNDPRCTSCKSQTILIAKAT